MYFLLIITLALAALLVFNTLASILATVLWRRAAIFGLAIDLTARHKAQRIFAWRIFPLAAAFLFITAFMLPAYFLFEPQKSGEIVSLKLTLLAVISGLGMISACYRVLLTSRATKQLLNNWLRNAEPIIIKNVSIPVYTIHHSFPVVAVVGAIRPKMFVARQIFDSLEPAEIQAVITHEQGHLVSQDNLKRALMRFCRDLILIPHGSELERGWAETTEIAADEYAARAGGKNMALNLASALVKIARLVPDGAHPAMPAGAFLIEAQTSGVSERVCNLLALIQTENFGAKLDQNKSTINFWIYLSGIASIIFLLATRQTILLTVHEALEVAVSILR